MPEEWELSPKRTTGPGCGGPRLEASAPEDNLEDLDISVKHLTNPTIKETLFAIIIQINLTKTIF